MSWCIQETFRRNNWCMYIQISFLKPHFWFILISVQKGFPKFEFPDLGCGLPVSAAYTPVFMVFFSMSSSDVFFSLDKWVLYGTKEHYLSCSYKVFVVMNGQTKNIISVTVVESLLMTSWTVHYPKSCYVKHYLIWLRVEQVVTCIVTMVPVATGIKIRCEILPGNNKKYFLTRQFINIDHHLMV